MPFSDIAKKPVLTAAANSSRNSSPEVGSYDDHVAQPPSRLKRLVDSFREDECRRARRRGNVNIYDAHGIQQMQLEDGDSNSKNENGLARKLKARHVQMIAIGGSIGTGLFVASGKALATGGPASLIICFALIGIMLFCTVQALGELAVQFPVSGSFSSYSTRFLDPAWGFAMGWNYALQWLTVLPLEVIAASVTIEYWNKDLSRAIFVTVFLALIIVVNLVGVKAYGEAEFIFSIIKVIAVIGWIILGIVVNCGGGPKGSYIGGKYWFNPGAFNDGFKGLCSVFVTAAFAFSGTELVGLAAAETANPRKSVPTAVKQVFWRISLFYMISLTVIGLLVPYNDRRLLQSEGSGTAATSPFVIAIQEAGIQALPSIMNVVILIAVISVGNSAIYGSSRTLAALAEHGQAPQIFGYIDRRGRPMVSIILASSLGLLSYVAVSNQQATVLTWLLALSGLSSIFTWGSINLAHIRYRRAWAAQGHSLDEVVFRSQSGVIGSWIGLGFNCLVLIAQFWVGAWPIGYSAMTAKKRVEVFFQAYLAAPIVVISYFAYKWSRGTKICGSATMDLDTGRRQLDARSLMAEEEAEKAERATWPKWKRYYKVCC